MDYKLKVGTRIQYMDDDDDTGVIRKIVFDHESNMYMYKVEWDGDEYTPSWGLFEATELTPLLNGLELAVLKAKESV
jgi:hypothetical protein